MAVNSRVITAVWPASPLASHSGPATQDNKIKFVFCVTDVENIAIYALSHGDMVQFLRLRVKFFGFLMGRGLNESL